MKGSQTEGVCWLYEQIVYFQQEQRPNVFNQAVFQLNLADVVKHLD